MFVSVDYVATLAVVGDCIAVSDRLPVINPLKTKRRLLYLKTQFVPRSKHFSSRL